MKIRGKVTVTGIEGKGYVGNVRFGRLSSYYSYLGCDAV